MKTILVLAANPQDTSRLRLDEEVREIDQGLRRARHRDAFTLRQQWAARTQEVRRSMLDHRPQIVHFCGHGAGDSGIAFEDDAGNAHHVDAETLAEFFGLFAEEVECVVLNACYSELQARAIARHIHHVIGMRREIGDRAALEFSVAFYDGLGAGKPVEFAYRLACNAIRMAGIPEHLTPVLLTRDGTEGPSPAKPTTGPSPTTEARAPAAGPSHAQWAIAIALSLLSLTLLLLRLWPEPQGHLAPAETTAPAPTSVAPAQAPASGDTVTELVASGRQTATAAPLQTITQEHITGELFGCARQGEGVVCDLRLATDRDESLILDADNTEYGVRSLIIDSEGEEHPAQSIRIGGQESGERIEAEFFAAIPRRLQLQFRVARGDQIPVLMLAGYSGGLHFDIRMRFHSVPISD